MSKFKGSKDVVSFMALDMADKIWNQKIESDQEIIQLVGLLKLIPYILTKLTDEELIEIHDMIITNQFEPEDMIAADDVDEIMANIIKKAQ